MRRDVEGHSSIDWLTEIHHVSCGICLRSKWAHWQAAHSSTEHINLGQIRVVSILTLRQFRKKSMVKMVAVNVSKCNWKTRKGSVDLSRPRGGFIDYSIQTQPQGSGTDKWLAIKNESHRIRNQEVEEMDKLHSHVCQHHEDPRQQ